MPRLSPYFALLAVAWMVVMTARLYPQFGDAVRVEGRLTTVDDYIENACGERVGPAAETCLAETRVAAQRLLRREQSKSILLIEAPVIGYFFLYLPAALWLGRRRARRAG